MDLTFRFDDLPALRAGVYRQIMRRYAIPRAAN
jgi:hypothetical protein